MRNKFMVAAVLALTQFAGSGLASELPATEDENPDYDKGTDTFSVEYICEDLGCDDSVDRNDDGRVDREELNHLKYEETSFEDGSVYDLNQDGDVTFDEFNSVANRDEVFMYVNLAKDEGRWDLVFSFMKEIADMDGQISEKERDMFVEIYDFHVMNLRQSYRDIKSAFFIEYEAQKDKMNNRLLNRMEFELIYELQSLIGTLEHLIIDTTDIADKVLFWQLKASSQRYLWELEPERYQEDTINSFILGRQESHNIPTTHPNRLHLDLRFVQFLIELGQVGYRVWAYDAAVTSYEQAMSDIAEIDDAYYTEAMQEIEILGQYVDFLKNH